MRIFSDELGMRKGNLLSDQRSELLNEHSGFRSIGSHFKFVL